VSDADATRRFQCPWLRGDVELTQEREQHIQERHPDVRADAARLFSRWYTDVRSGRHVVVVVLSEPSLSARNWIVTAYSTRSLAVGEIEWRRS